MLYWSQNWFLSPPHMMITFWCLMWHTQWVSSNSRSRKGYRNVTQVLLVHIMLHPVSFLIDIFLHEWPITAKFSFATAHVLYQQSMADPYLCCSRVVCDSRPAGSAAQRTWLPAVLPHVPGWRVAGGSVKTLTANRWKHSFTFRRHCWHGVSAASQLLPATTCCCDSVI